MADDLATLRERIDRISKRLDALAGNNAAIMQLADRMLINQHLEVAGGLAVGSEASAEADSLTIRDASATPSTPASSFARTYTRNGAPYVKRSSGNISPLVQGDEILKELPYAQVWGGTRYLNGAGWRIIDHNGGGNHLSPVGAIFCETAAGQLGLGRSFAVNQLDGSTGYATIAGAANLMVALNSYIVGGWFKVNSLNRNNGFVQGGHTTQAFELYVNSGNAVAFRSYHGATGYASAGAIASAGWHFIAGQSFWLSTSNWVERVFIDGVYYNYSGAAPTAASRTPVGDFRVGLAYNNSYYLAGEFYRVFNAYGSSYGMNMVEEYYHLTKNHFQ